MRDFLLCCFQKNPEDRPTARTLQDHPWIQYHQRNAKASNTSVTTPASNPDNVSVSSDSSKQDTVSNTSSRRRRRSSVRTSIESAHRQTPVHPLDPAQPHHSSSPPNQNEDYATHRFIQTSFGKRKWKIWFCLWWLNSHHHLFLILLLVVECKVCGDLLSEQAIFCEICSLICHDGCKQSAFSCPPKVNEQQPSYDVSWKKKKNSPYLLWCS